MIEEVLRYCKRLRPDDGFVADSIEGTFTVESGTLQTILPSAVPGQYIHIIGSKLNDGVFLYPANELSDETFTGTIRVLSLPPTFIKLCNDMQSWQDKNGDAAQSPFNSESFGGYSYQKAVGTGASSGTADVWSTFKKRLTVWRKI